METKVKIKYKGRVYPTLSVILLLVLCGIVFAQRNVVERVYFARGRTTAILRGAVVGQDES
jgi:hypothetical protein